MAYYTKLDKALQSRLEKTIEDMFPAQLEALQALVKIESVKQPPEGDYPFGLPMQKALDYTLELCREHGLETRDLDGYVGIAEHKAGEETLGILAHLDVVPAGTGWSVPPFCGEIIDGQLYGRGVMDDKGPAISALFALSAINRCNIPLKRNVQLILGCDEESGWACMDRFHKTEPMPTLSFTPDAEYPLVYSERTIVQGIYEAKPANTQITIDCGERTNVVPGQALAILPQPIKLPEAPDGFEIKTEQKADGFHVLVLGLGAHASTPELGKNAMQCLLALLVQALPEGEDLTRLRALHEAFKMDNHAETLGLDAEDESGRLTLNPGILHWDKEKISFGFDARSPVCLSAGTIFERIDTALAPAGFVRDEAKSRVQPGHHVPLESELVQKLLGVYRTQTGDTKTQPLAIGGGTYARAMKNAVAFGCEYPGDVMVAHMPDERCKLTDILRNTHIMADAILALAGE
ncbi:Sapep family Mn(2+)-dependent dipeptidase [Eubacteriales bacterium OttesenSCG-928-K08]|nr:Sapep family Mn(2+)-dependent dipeptidase [Eubacteriales bacterium OttesenSCG-928-K08]